MTYEERINVPNVSYGIEIEFAGTSIYDVDKKLIELLGDNYKPYGKIDYSKWCLQDDYTVQIRKYGGEVTTPIMNNTLKNWKELKRVCELLRSFPDLLIDGNCSVHVHVDKEIYNNVEEYINLLKIWMIYEDIIYRFGYGEKNCPRELLFRYAKPFGFYINMLLCKLDNSASFDLLFNSFWEKFVGLNLAHKNTIENRIFNGTLNESIIQNDVLFTLNLLKSAKNNYFDKEFIDFKVKNYKPIFINNSILIDEKRAIEFANMIYSESSDKEKFYTQYYKNMI